MLFMQNPLDDISIIPTFVLTPLTYLGGGILFYFDATRILAKYFAF